MSEIELKPCPFCGGTDLELKDYTENVYGFWDYKIRCKTCRAYMDSPSTADIRLYDGYIRQTRNDETKAKAKRELIIAWNRRTDNGQIDGRWEKRVFIVFDSEKVGYRCSKCNTTWDTETPHCPHCGEKMKGGTE